MPEQNFQRYLNVKCTAARGFGLLGLSQAKAMLTIRWNSPGLPVYSVFLMMTVLLLSPQLVAQELTRAQLDQLERGEIVLVEQARPGSEHSVYSVYGLIPAKLEQIESVLSAYEQYPEFMPNVVRMTVRNRSETSVELDYYLSLPVGLKKQYRLMMQKEKQADTLVMRWRKLPWPELDPDNTIRATEGYWHLQVHNGQVLAKYHVWTDPGDVPFGLGWVVDYMSSKSIVEVVRNTRDRVLAVTGN